MLEYEPVAKAEDVVLLTAIGRLPMRWCSVDTGRNNVTQT
jgi:hypothetical protein